MAKRYVLLVAGEDLSESDMKELSSLLEARHGKVKVIPLESNPRAVIVKTTNAVAPLLRAQSGELRLGEKRLSTVLTSGSIGKLKSRASESKMPSDVKVP